MKLSINEFNSLLSILFKTLSWKTYFVTGGGADSEGELIEVVYLSVQEVKDYMNQDEIPSPATFLSGVSWFLANKQDRYAWLDSSG